MEERSSWFIGTWGECSTTCGEGTRSRDVFCIGSALNYLKHLCAEVTPASSKSCEDYTTCPHYPFCIFGKQFCTWHQWAVLGLFVVAAFCLCVCLLHVILSRQQLTSSDEKICVKQTTVDTVEVPVIVDSIRTPQTTIIGEPPGYWEVVQNGEVQAAGLGVAEENNQVRGNINGAHGDTRLMVENRETQNITTPRSSERSAPPSKSFQRAPSSESARRVEQSPLNVRGECGGNCGMPSFFLLEAKERDLQLTGSERARAARDAQFKYDTAY